MSTQTTERKFDFIRGDWEEIYNTLGSDGVIAKLDESEGPLEPLTDQDWLEIYLSLDAKLDELKTGFYGRDRLVKDWKQHMRDMLKTLDPIRAQYIGGKK